MRFGSVLVCLLATAGSASAQSAYVGATLFGDVIRMSGSSVDSSSGGGETYGGALRAGTPLGERWGVELEFARTGEIETAPALVFPAGLPGGAIEWHSGSSSGFLSSITAATMIFPAPRIESQRRLATIAALLWRDHQLSERLSLVYLGGVAFTRTTWKLRISYPDFPVFPLPIPRPTIFPPPDLDQETTFYDAEVAVGFEGRIRMTEHVLLVPGIRLQTIPDGWSIRPGVGLQWGF